MASVSTSLESAKMENKTKHEILSAVRSLESFYKCHTTPLDADHRRHLDREELLRVYHLVRKVLNKKQKVTLSQRIHRGAELGGSHLAVK